MITAADKVKHLRGLLEERFGRAVLAAPEVCDLGVPALENYAIPKGALTEIVAEQKRGGVTLLLYSVLRSWLGVKRQRAVLVDGRDSFGPRGLKQEELDRLLWLRCRDASEGMKVADLVVRDGNLPLVRRRRGIDCNCWRSEVGQPCSC